MVEIFTNAALFHRIHKDFDLMHKMYCTLFVTVILESITSLELHPVTHMTQRNKDSSDLDVD